MATNNWNATVKITRDQNRSRAFVLTFRTEDMTLPLLGEDFRYAYLKGKISISKVSPRTDKHHDSENDTALVGLKIYLQIKIAHNGSVNNAYRL